MRLFPPPAPVHRTPFLRGHADLVYSLAFHPDGKLLATAGFDSVVKLWDFPGGKEVRTLSGHGGPVYCVTFSPDGKLLASSSQDQTIRLWNVGDGKLLRQLRGHAGIVDSVAFSPDSKLLASGGQDRSVRLWNPADGKALKSLGTHDKAVYAVAFSPDGKLLASAGAEGVIKLWDTKAQKEVRALKGHSGPVTGVIFAADGAQLFSIGMEDRCVRVWDVARGAETKHLGPAPDYLFGIALSRDGKTLATSGYGGSVILWDVAAGKPAQTYKLPYGAYCIAFTPDGKALVTGHADHNCYLTTLTSSGGNPKFQAPNSKQ